jgi:hypothetical protein
VRGFTAEQNGGGGEHRPWLIDVNQSRFVTDVRSHSRSQADWGEGQFGLLLPLVLGQHEWLSFVWVQVYRRFVDIHYSLGSYLLAIGSAALENGTSSLQPLAPHQSFIDKVGRGYKPDGRGLHVASFCSILSLMQVVDNFDPPTYAYLLGDRLLVNPINHLGASQWGCGEGACMNVWLVGWWVGEVGL